MSQINDVRDEIDKKKQVLNQQIYIDTYNVFDKFLYNQGTKGITNIFVTEFLQFINEVPKLAIPMLLWIDTFHDFKRTRAKKSKDESEDLTPSINNVLDFYIRNKLGTWTESDFTTKIKSKPNSPSQTVYSETAHYSISKCFRDSFFDYTEYNQNPKEHKYWRYDDGYTSMAFYPFHKEVKDTVLRPCYEWDLENNEKCNEKYKDITSELRYQLQHQCARILYQMSLIVYDTIEPFEPQLLYTYILYNFLKNDNKKNNKEYIRGDHIKRGLEKSVFTYINKNFVQYYAKDVDTKKTTSVLEDAKLIILPASLFDKNKANSSDDSTNFANITQTIIPYDFNDKSFVYNYNNDINNKCNLTVTPPWDENKTNLTFNNSCTGGTLPSYTSNFKNIIFNFSSYINPDTIEFTTNNIHIYSKKQDLLEDISKIKNSANTYKLSGNTAKDGFSVDEISIRLLIEIINNVDNNVDNNIINKKENDKYKYKLLSPYCFDKYMSLKRVGDFGQILQCKQLGIPLITDDNMQILLSIACCSSVIWTPSDRLMYYNGNSDCFINVFDNNCSINRKNTEYKNIINTQVLGNIGGGINIDIQKILSDVKPFKEQWNFQNYQIDIQPTFEQIVLNKIEIEQERKNKKILLEIAKKEEEKKVEQEDINNLLKTLQLLYNFKKYCNNDKSKFDKLLLYICKDQYNKDVSFNDKPYSSYKPDYFDEVNNNKKIKEVLKELNYSDEYIDKLTDNDIESIINDINNNIKLLNCGASFEKTKRERPPPKQPIQYSAKKQRQNQRIKSKYRTIKKNSSNKYRKNK
jgi:hypothetical protein